MPKITQHRSFCEKTTECTSWPYNLQV